MKHLIQSFEHQTNLFTITQQNHINLMVQAMQQLMKQKIQSDQEKFYFTLSKLNTLSPLKTLERGYAIILKDEKLISSSLDLKSGDKVEIKMKDGMKNAIIE